MDPNYFYKYFLGEFDGPQGKRRSPSEAVALKESEFTEKLVKLARLRDLMQSNPEFLEFLALAKEFGL